MALALQEERVHANADERDRQSRSQAMAQMRNLHPPGDPSRQALPNRTFKGSPKAADIVSDAGERQIHALSPESAAAAGDRRALGQKLQPLIKSLLTLEAGGDADPLSVRRVLAHGYRCLATGPSAWRRHAGRRLPRSPFPHGQTDESAGALLTGAHIKAMDGSMSAIEAIRDDFASLDEWEDRYRYVIELGHTLEPLGEAAHNDLNKVRGCVSQVWLECEPATNGEGQTILRFRGDSDSHLVRGLIAIAIALFSGRTPDEILKTDAHAAFRALGLEQHLTPQRSNGVRSMIERIRTDAAGLRLGAA